MYPKKLYLEITTNCNMSCGMCVKQAPGSLISNKHQDISVFNRLLPVFPKLGALVLNGIGEPLMNPHLLAMVSTARERMGTESWVGFQTNGLLLSETLAEQLLGVGLDRLCISVDSLPGQNRNGLSLAHDSNFTRSPYSVVNDLRHRMKIQNFQLGAQIVVMRETVNQLPELISQLAGEGVDFILVSHLLPYYQEVEKQSLFFHHTPEARTIYRKWQKLANEEGIDLAELTAKTWIAPMNLKEQRTKDLYGKMLKDARDQGVWLNVKNLGELDRDSMEEITGIFTTSQKIADQSGIDLSLPPLVATSDRCCTFIEEDAVFVDVNGTVTPCHQLWHTQPVHMGETKKIHCKSFGNILEQDLLEIYQSEPYRQFRKAVRRYDYPFCYSCTLGPCSDIIGENQPFQSDCFGIEVPCGHCLWGFDAIRCL